jgi:peptide/nickel transport system substrate-binding protein
MRKPMTYLWAKYLGATLTLLLAACGGDGSDGAGAAVGDPVPGGTAVLGVLGDFQAFNPVTNTHLTSDDVGKYMLFTPLIQYDEDLNPQPYLAESWELSDSSVVFRLRNDVTWHDGQPVTAEDVKFTFDLAKNPETASLLGSAYIPLIKSATVIDPNTIRFDFVAPHAQALEGFWWAPLPKHLLQDVAPAQLAQAPFNRNPVGSGPFKFVSWESGQRLTLEANPQFPEALGGRPNLDRVVFRVLAEPTVMVTELVNGSADLIGYTLLPDQAVQLRNQRGVTLKNFPYREFAYVAWNNERPIFQDARVRRALALAIDRPQIIEALLQGFGEPASTFIPNWSPLNPELEPLPHDPERAKQLLAEAGWTDSNGDGILDRNGQPFRFTILTNTENRLRQDIATVIQDQLRQIGVQAEVRTTEFQTMLQQFRARNYDAVVSNWILDTFKVDPTPLFSCQEARTANSANRTGYCNPQADQIAERALRTTDAGAAKQLWAQYSQLLQQDQPLTFLYWTEDLAGVGPRLQGVEMDQRSKLVSVRDWWIPADRQR